MSYILDALKKSEKERAVGNVPTLDIVYDRPPRPRRSSGKRWRLISIVIFVGVVSAVGYVYKTEISAVVAKYTSDNGSDTPKVLTRTSTGGNQKPKPTQAVATRQNTGLIKRPRYATKQTSEISKLANTQNPKPTKTAANSTPTDKNSVSNSVAKVNTQQREAKSAVIPLSNAKSINRSNTGAVKPVSTSVGVEKSNNSRTQLKLVTIDDLEPAFRKNVPVVNIQAVSYSENDARRFVMIDQHIYKEGDELKNGLRVEQVTPDGPVVSFRGRRFMLRP